MFDRNYLSAHQTVNVKVADPNAADIARLLDELQNQAQKNIDAAIRLDNNEFKAVVHLNRDMASDDLQGIVNFTLNGLQMKAVYKHPMFRFDSVEFVKGMVQEVANQIAGEILRRQFHGNKQLVESLIRIQRN